MPEWFFQALYVAALLAETFIRAPINRQRKQNKIITDKVNLTEAAVLILLLLGNFILPMLYIFTPWLNFANYTLPLWARWLGVPLMLAALWVFWQAHHALGRNWSPSLQLREGHTLITNGIYNSIRHPMYASQLLLALAQTLLLPNWLAGVGGLIVFLPLYFLRVPVEEQMMLTEFGSEYEAYLRRTGRLFPKLTR